MTVIEILKNKTFCLIGSYTNLPFMEIACNGSPLPCNGNPPPFNGSPLTFMETIFEKQGIIICRKHF
jgi:uncharacterized Zn-finger protein